MNPGPMKIVLVICGRSRDFIDGIARLVPPGKYAEIDRTRFVARYDGKEYRLISQPHQLRGFHGVEVEFWGDLSEKENVTEFYELAQIARMP